MFHNTSLVFHFLLLIERKFHTKISFCLNVDALLVFDKQTDYNNSNNIYETTMTEKEDGVATLSCIGGCNSKLFAERKRRRRAVYIPSKDDNRKPLGIRPSESTSAEGNLVPKRVRGVKRMRKRRDRAKKYILNRSLFLNALLIIMLFAHS